VATRKVPLLDGEMLKHFSTAMNTTEEAFRFRSHGNEPPTHSNREERDNSTVEGGDLHTVRPDPTSGTELTNRRQNTIEDRQKSEVKSLFYVV
jgi:hypothetical protein